MLDINTKFEVTNEVEIFCIDLRWITHLTNQLFMPIQVDLKPPVPTLKIKGAFQSMKTLSVYNEDTAFDIFVEEYLEYEPAMYIHEDGYLCIDGWTSREYFVSLTGRVDLKENGKWIMGWGVCPKLKNEFDLIEAAIGEET